MSLFSGHVLPHVADRRPRMRNRALIGFAASAFVALAFFGVPVPFAVAGAAARGAV